MYLDTSKSNYNNKTYTRALLRTTYRDKKDGKIKHKTIANLGECTSEEIAAIKLALQYKGDLGKLADIRDVQLQQGLHIGALLLLTAIAKKLRITKALQDILQDKTEVGVTLWQIFARIIYQGSRLSAFNMSKHHALQDCLGIEFGNKNQMYNNLKVVSDNIGRLEKQLFKLRDGYASNLYLYDVTSSYLEGTCNEYGAYGYNRDKKSGKQQIVIGLLTDENGIPVACRVFDGNTVDTKTVGTQIQLLANEFGVKNITLVGDRGMLKTPQINELPSGFNYITAISKAQIQTLLKADIINYELFDKELTEVIDNNNRYILRLNPYRRDEIRATRQSKYDKLNVFLTEQNLYLQEHKKAKTETAYRKIYNKLNAYKLDYVSVTVNENERSLSLCIDINQLAQLEQLDGCYCLKTDILDVDKALIHARYKDLAKVENAFRTMKQEHLDIRPIYVRKKSSTDAHVFITMLAYMITQELEKLWHDCGYTVQQAISLINSITYQEVLITNQKTQLRIPKPTAEIELLLAKANVVLPTIKSNVTTK